MIQHCPVPVSYTHLAHVICSVLSPFNSFMTGSIIPVDGGLTAK